MMTPDPGPVQWMPTRRITTTESVIAVALLFAAVLAVGLGAQGVIAIARACA